MIAASRSVPEPGAHLPDDIAASWRRTSATGLRCADDVRVDPITGPSRGRLAVAAAAVLGRFQAEIADAPFGVALADRTGRVIDVRFGRRSMLRRAADTFGLVPGATFDEECTGTNALSVPFETQHEIFIEGDQHYLESMRAFTCFGQPIHHPTTARFEGVIDIMTVREHASALMRPALRRLVAEISAALAGSTDRPSRSAYELFRTRSDGATAPMVLFDEDVVIANRAARQELEAADYNALSELVTAELVTGQGGCASLRRLELRSGAVVVVESAPADSGVICTLLDGHRPALAVPRGRNAIRSAGQMLQHEVDRLRRRPDVHVVVAGEAGTGRSSIARQITEPTETVVHRCTGEEAVDGGALERFAVLGGGVSIVVDDADRLSPRNLRRLVTAMDGGASRFVVTVSSGDKAGADHEAMLTACCAEKIVLPPLRERSDELGALTAGVLDELTQGSTRVSLGALRLLRAHRWPGNFHELRAVLRAASQRRGTGDIGAGDLPSAFVDAGARSRITTLQRAEADAIERALRSTGGNKVRAADRLGISRSTLYARVRAYDIRV